MKKLILLLLFFILLFIPLVSHAQEGESSPSAEVKVEYTLPYPGLLPDSPFYFLKTTRDKVVSFLISNPLRKAEFNLLQADKRLSAGIYLANKEKYELSNITISKGENYFEAALSKAEEAKNQGIFIENLAINLYNSSKKHQEVIKDLEEKTKGDLKTKFSAEAKRAVEFERKAKSLLPQ